ncbi:RHS repeat-associated core domain-containing protein, partial [Burkholderia sp. Bp9004]|uniref:RHS repeat-associated core domain-containing protein n=1 Tax=Burkholderia sp. Bp9004 TaxID=2184559 RepID=UPI000F97F3CE
QYAGTHYQYDARGNLTQRWHNGKEGRFTWDLFDRLTHYEDERLKVDYTYDALGRRLSKHSQAHYEERSEAGPHWNRAERVKRNRALQCGFTLYGWDGDTLAWESKIADEDGFGARTTHYVYEPGSFVPVAQAVREEAIELLDQPEYGDYYRQDEDPLWLPPPPAPAIDSLAWYQCDHLGTPQELTDEHSEIAWSAEYRAWGVAQEAIRKASGKAPIVNPIRFQGQYNDHESGLHYNRHRYYDPSSGRFVSKDPIGLAGGINVYQYAPNPIEWSDPLGLSRTPVGAGRKQTSSKANQNANCPCRGKWKVNHFDRVCSGNVPGVGHAKYVRDPGAGMWWSEDQTGHGDSAWKVYDKNGVWVADADVYGDYMKKHKSDTGKNIDFKSLKCKDSK